MGEEVSPLSPSPAAACAALPSVEQQVERELQKTQNRFHLSLGAALLFAFLFFFSSLPAASASSAAMGAAVAPSAHGIRTRRLHGVRGGGAGSRGRGSAADCRTFRAAVTHPAQQINQQGVVLSLLGTSIIAFCSGQPHP